jgi:hypothetical protein
MELTRERLQHPLPNPRKNNQIPPAFPVSNLPNTVNNPIWIDIAEAYIANIFPYRLFTVFGRFETGNDGGT